MTKKLFFVLPGLVLLSCSAGDVQANDTNTTSPNGVGTSTAAYNSLISKTTAYPDSYSQPADQQGTMTELPYNTRDYVNGTSTTRTNNAYVYLPYNYDESGNTRYNVVYLVHGHYGDASTFLTTENGLLHNVLDHMIENGELACHLQSGGPYGRPIALVSTIV